MFEVTLKSLIVSSHRLHSKQKRSFEFFSYEIIMIESKQAIFWHHKLYLMQGPHRKELEANGSRRSAKGTRKDSVTMDMRIHLIFSVCDLPAPSAPVWRVNFMNIDKTEFLSPALLVYSYQCKEGWRNIEQKSNYR